MADMKPGPAIVGTSGLEQMLLTYLDGHLLLERCRTVQMRFSLCGVTSAPGSPSTSLRLLYDINLLEVCVKHNGANGANGASFDDNTEHLT